MKQLSLLGFFLLTLIACKKEKTQEPATASYHTFTGGMGIADNSTCLSGDGNLLICGNVAYGSDVSVLKITKSGTQVWRTDFDAGVLSSAQGIVEKNGEIFVCGNTHRNIGSQTDVLLIKLNAIGDTIWTKTYGSTDDDYGSNIIATSDGNILISGFTDGFSAAGSYSDIYLVKVDMQGNLLWETSYPNPDQESAFHLLETQNGEYLVTGTDEDPGDSGRSLLLLKVNASGQQLWSKKIGPVWKWGYSAIELASGELVICGQHTLPDHQSQVILLKTDNLGNVIWEKDYGSSEFGISEKGNSVKQNADGTFTITGSVFEVNNSIVKIILLKTDENGNQLWFKKFNDYYGGNAKNLIKDGDDNILTGDRNGSMFITKTDGNGNYK